MERYLRYDPVRISKSRIKKLRDLRRPQYRLRVDELRVFYDVVDQEVQVLGIVAKADSEAWLKQAGEQS